MKCKLSITDTFSTSLKFFCTPAALCGVVMYNYIKVKDVRAQQSVEGLPERMTKVNFMDYP
jgi:hypothetical protein